MKILLLEELSFISLEEIKNNLQSYYTSQIPDFDSQKFEIIFMKTIGTNVDDNFYIWLNDSVVNLKNYSFEEIKIPENFLPKYMDTFPHKEFFDDIYLKLFKEPKDSYEVFYIPMTLSMKIFYYGKEFISFYDFISGKYTYDPLTFSMSDIEKYYTTLYEGYASWKKLDKYYLMIENDKLVRYIKLDLPIPNNVKIDKRIKRSFADNFIKNKYNSEYSIIAFGEIARVYLLSGKIITVNFETEKVVKEDRALSIEQLLNKIKHSVSLSNVKYYTFYKDKIYVNLYNDEKQILVIANLNGKILHIYQILKEKGLKNIIDFSKFSEIKVKRTQEPVFEDEYIPGYYDVIAYNHDFQLTYRIYDDGRYELISKQILIATAIEKSEHYLKTVRLVRFPSFIKEKSKFNASDNSWILYFSGRDVEYTLKVYVQDGDILVKPVRIETSLKRIEYLCKKILGLNVKSINSKKNIFSGKEVWDVKYLDKNNKIKTMKITSEDELLKYYKKDSQ